MVSCPSYNFLILCGNRTSRQVIVLSHHVKNIRADSLEAFYKRFSANNLPASNISHMLKNILFLIANYRLNTR